jgi:hypothetical protein
MWSVLTIDTSCWFASKLGGAATAANSIRGGYLSSDEPGRPADPEAFGCRENRAATKPLAFYRRTDMIPKK